MGLQCCNHFVFVQGVDNGDEGWKFEESGSRQGDCPMRSMAGFVVV